jgi:hypothetical protein
MKKFSELGVTSNIQTFTGEKIKPSKILNRKITVLDYKIEDSKFGKNNEKCLYLQIELDGEKRVVFTGSVVLAETIQKIAKTDFPFSTVIVKENERYEFT